MFREKGDFEDGVAACRRAVALAPGDARVHFNLGFGLKSEGKLDEAIAAYRQAILIKPDYAEAYNNLGNALKERGRLDEAVAAYRQAIAVKGDYARAFNNLGNALKDMGEVGEAIVALRRAVECEPGNAAIGSNLVYALHFDPACDAQGILSEHRRWFEVHARALAAQHVRHDNDRSPDRRLRIGYVSAYFREHCQSLFTVPLLTNHDHDSFQILAYSDVGRADAFTERLAARADVWQEVGGLSDEELAGRIRGDGIDVLVDLTMHMSHGRPLLMARKPAPVQVAWLAYPSTTGIETMDYRLTDPHLDPPGNDRFYSEKSIRLPETFWCYDPMTSDLPVNELPAAAAGHVTFGCLNNFGKVNEGVLVLWARVMRQVEGSRLLLLAEPGSHWQRTVERMGREGIDAERIEFVPPRIRRQYLELNHRIDLGLDSFPYNGHTTSLDSFWMGVPVISLVGQTAVSRAGLCQLTNLGMPELAGRTAERFVQIAVELARDLPRLSGIRASLRRRMEQSPLMDAARFARNVEAAYRGMWQAWCETNTERKN
jgi:protein O-GlcNAc transferase